MPEQRFATRIMAGCWGKVLRRDEGRTSTSPACLHNLVQFDAPYTGRQAQCDRDEGRGFPVLLNAPCSMLCALSPER
jgi:hypothetical protein